MTTRFLPYLSCILLTACMTPPPASAPMPPIKCAPVATTAAAPAPATSPEAVNELLAYHRSLRQLPPTELIKELANLDLQPATPRLALQKAMVLSLTHGSDNLLQAQAYLDGVLHSTAPDAIQLKPLAQLLSANNAELQRLTALLDKSTQQVRDSQRRIDQLNGMLEGLKAIERTLPVRPNALTPRTAK